VAALPFASNSVYFAIQRTFGDFRKGLNNPVDRFVAAIHMVEWIEDAGASIAGKRFVEVGTGFMVNLPTALWLLGAGETITVDVNRYLSGSIVKESNDSIREHEREVLQMFGDRATDDGFRTRFDRLLSFSGNLDALLDMMNVRYISPGDAGALPLPDKSVDFHVSHTVLEHVPPPVISKILAEAKRVMVSGGLFLHNVDPSDHFCHEDMEIPAVNFLRFSDAEWDKWAGNQFMYHNRLRASQYLDLFRSAGVHVLRSESAVDDRSLSALERGFPVDSRFSGMTREDLATRWLRVIGTFDEVSEK
jgi:SAM-dependent methyltransferase